MKLRNSVWGILIFLAVFTGVYFFVDYDIPQIGVQVECFLQSAGGFVIVLAIGALIILALGLLVRFIIKPSIEWTSDHLPKGVGNAIDSIPTPPDWVICTSVAVFFWVAMALIFYSQECGGQ